MSGRIAKEWPLTMEIVEGDPIQVEGRELTPSVRVTSWVRRRASVGEGVVGQGWGVVHMRPLAVLDRSDDGQAPLLIHDRTARSIRRLFFVALVVPCVAAVLMCLARRVTRRKPVGLTTV